MDTVLAQGGFVGHRDGFRSNEGGFLGDATGSIIPLSSRPPRTRASGPAWATT